MHKKNTTATKFQLALNLHQQGKLTEAEALYKAVLKTQPQHTDALHLLGVIAQQQGQNQKAIDLIQQALKINPNNVIAHSNLGLTFQALHRYNEALASHERALALQTNSAETYYNRGNTLVALLRSDEALLSYERALTINPHYEKALFNRGNVLLDAQRYNEALSSYDRALAIQPNYVEALTNRGSALQALGYLDEALVSYDRALSLKPNHAKALYNRGNLLATRRHFEQALINYDKALAIQPNYAKALANRGSALQNLKRYELALASYERALAIQPDLNFIFGDWLFMKMNICDWDNLELPFHQLAAAIERGEKVSSPFPVLAWSTSAALQKKAATLYMQAKYPPALRLPPIAKHAHQKIKVGYFSSDFRNHPVSYLTAELFERHDRTRFESIAFSFHAATQKDAMRLRLESTFDQFIDVSQQSDEQVVQLARQLEIDIAVDLNGCTEGCRTHIFALRAAPIQVSYLGYLGTMGVDYMDYLLADPTLIPEEHQPYYTEKIAYLPHSFQVNDSTQAISDKTWTRAELGLPAQGFIFCCFNSHYKITPSVFTRWMKILQHVEGSVLWLLTGNVVAENNLRLAASAQGIAAERLIFADRVPIPEHIARHRLANLFLDTQPYNAGATASAALWAGLPVLTCLGETFAGRMAAGLLKAIGLPELITDTLEDYEALAIQLAMQPEQLATIKRRLADNRLLYPLFDTALLTQHIESAFQAMFDRYQAGLVADHIYVSA